MENTNMPVISAKDLNLWYGDFKALKGISLDVGEREITALIGPSGCGKSTFLKTLNRMNDLVPNVRIEGDVRLKGEDIFAREMQLTDLRRRVGMVFQKANPFPMSIYDNITYGPKLHGVRNKAELDELVESSLREVDPNIIEAAQSMGATPMQIICKVMIPESVPSLIQNVTISLTTILGYSAMSGIIGGGGLGKVAIDYGYYRYKYLVMFAAVILLILLVQLFQTVGTKLAVKCDKRLKK